MSFRTDTGWRRSWWVAVGAALLAHVALLSQISGFELESGGRRAGPMTVTYVRQALVRPRAEPPGSESAATAAPTHVAAPAQGVAVPPTVPQPRVEPQAPPPSQATVAAAGSGGDAEFDGYLPRSRLTVPPQPLRPVVVPFPDEVRGIVELKVQIALFIDETGTVRRVRFDSPDVPGPFMRAILDSFEPARFSPGEVDGTPVRSRVRIEVEFQARRPR